MKERYTYEIATTDHSGAWQQTTLRDDTFSRDPASVARALLESWIIDHPRELTGGERVRVYSAASRDAPTDMERGVRVKVYRGSLADHESEPAAYGYVSHDERDFRVIQRPYDPTDQWRRLGASVRKTASDRRVGAGVAAAATLLLGYAATRKLRTRKGTAGRTLFGKRRS
jgi:hypothetical protein